MDDNEFNKIKERVAKLLAMAKDASSPNEAAIAAKRARALMDAHQLTELDVTASKSDDFGWEDTDKPYRFVPMWKDFLSVAVAKYNDCQARQEWVSVPGKHYRYRVQRFYGYKDDVAVAREMYKRLAEAVEFWCKNHMRQKGFTSYIASVGDAYKKAMTSELCSRLAAMTTERDCIKLATGTSLVLVKAQAVNEQFGEPKYQDRKWNITRGEYAADAYDAYHAGKTRGQIYDINPQVQQ